MRLLVAIALLSGVLAARPAEPIHGRFGLALNAAEGGLRAKADPAFVARPLSVECWAKLADKKNFNILVACEPKSSAEHWELYTHAKSGCLALYVPGNKSTADVRATKDIVDGQWHCLAAVMDGREIRLYCDGQEVARAADNRAVKAGAGELAIGALVEGHLGCAGFIDEVRISRGARVVGAMAEQPFEPDADTLALWHFDEAAGAKAYADAAGKHAAARQKPGFGGGGKNDGGLLAKDLVRPKEGQVGVIAPESDITVLRKRFAAAMQEIKLRSLGRADDYRDALLADWDEQRWHLANQLSGREPLPSGAAEQVFDRQALVSAEDGDVLNVVLRRTTALLAMLQGMLPGPALAGQGRDLEALRVFAQRTPLGQTSRADAYLVACALEREIALANPLLNFDDILFVARGVYQGSRKGGLHGTADAFGQHFATQYFGFNSIPGGGLFIVRNFKGRPQIINLGEKSAVENGRRQGQRLTGGAFLSPDLAYDGRTVLFAWTQNRGQHEYEWTPETTWKIFRVNIDGTGLRQLTDGPWDDFDPCWLPNGRIAFISERRGGYIRCFGNLPVPQHCLHGMKADGTDIHPLSFFETGEWHPSVNNDGMIVYTRWDYVDRENCLGSNFWLCYPDGRNPRAPHGNYPYPWHTFADNRQGDGRKGRPYTEMNIRAIPNSPRYVLTAGPHHGEAFGSLCVLDLSAPDDGFMSQVKRITPYVRFPESEIEARQQYPYGTAWPLSEDFYLCNWWENLYLLDRFGNQVLLCENSLPCGGAINWDLRLIDPIPVRARPMPPALPTQTNEGDDARPDAPLARISVANVYETDQPFPAGTKLKYLRVLQNIPKTNPQMNSPENMGYHWENTPRVPLGIVPVEADGSAHFQAPVERELIFQVLDENFMAVQTMRSVTYAHRGEHLTCVGCHEPSHKTPATPVGVPLALQKPPAALQPEAGPVEPVTYYRLVKPVFERSCLPCHRAENKEPLNMGFEQLRPYVYYFAGGMRGHVMDADHGGTRAIPGRFGAHGSRLGRALLDQNHRGKIPAEDVHRIVLWLDANAMRLGAFHDEARQVNGEVVWPTIDCDPKNPQGMSRRAEAIAESKLGGR